MKLIHCVYCDGKAKTEKTTNQKEASWFTACDTCGAVVGFYEDKEECQMKWNKSNTIKKRKKK